MTAPLADLFLADSTAPAWAVWELLAPGCERRLLDVGQLVTIPVTAGGVVIIDARATPSLARTACRTLADLHPDIAVVVLANDTIWSLLDADWGCDEAVDENASPAQIRARLQWARRRTPLHLPGAAEPAPGGLFIDEDAWLARIGERELTLAFKEFELLRALAAEPGRVFTRSELLNDVWGADYFGGTRTVDVHVRRLRAKLGPDHDHIISTVRNVGYRLDLDG